MKKWDLEQDWKKATLVIGIIFTILVLDIINGSSLRFMEITGPECLATHLFQMSILALLFSLFTKKEARSKIQKRSSIIIIQTVLAMVIENKIGDYQYEKTKENLEEICLALEAYKTKEGKYPQTLKDLKPTFLRKIPKSGFGLFDSEIKYELIQNGKTRLDYKVKFGFICESYDCGSGINFSTWAMC
ncbi:hypothetical protein [Neolewinella persica]|uniref:hypothetical protein n=1 Tax=Neolewinella persica TaxID=70998 RepID=UPI00037F8262|nr:hypothetical protein [Neolewinella persica]